MRAAIVVLADMETHGDLGRVVNALIAAREFKDAGDEVRLIFDGAGTRAAGPARRSVAPGAPAVPAVSDTIASACGCCAAAFDAEQSLQRAEVRLLDEYRVIPASERWWPTATRFSRSDGRPAHGG
jgi:hypothetical protein